MAAARGKARGRRIVSSGDQFFLRSKPMAREVIRKLRGMECSFTFMHVCGTHQDTLIRHGLDAMLKETGIEILQGPGCPVCVTTQREIEECLLLARKGLTLAVFGDMLKVPGASGSLSDARAGGADVRIVYGIDDAVKLAKSRPRAEVVFMGIGFETTAPSTASAIASEPPQNFSVLSCHRTVPPALRTIVAMGEVRLNGLIEPGHVSAIIGTKPYEFLSKKYKMPQVVAGFEPLDLLMGILMLAQQARDGRAQVENEYARVVKPEGNPEALRLLHEVFEPSDVAWRGFPVIPGSGLSIRQKYGSYDARKKHGKILSDLDSLEFKEPKGCRCGEVLRGIMDSRDCPLFGKKCTPKTPVGPCMVSFEGSCAIMYKYGKA